MREPLALTSAKAPSLSVVIATLGGESLKGTIEQINRGKLVPSEILVCIPLNEASRVANLSFPNVRIVKTSCRGQVAQRAEGLKQAKGPLVLQLDDDIYLPEETLTTLAETLGYQGHGNVLAPVFFCAGTNQCCHEVKGGFFGWLQNIYYSVFCCAPWGTRRMGTITAIGISFGVDNKYCGAAPFETQWLPGGCILSYKNDLVTDDYFPFKGKAYSEDLILSYLRTKNGLRHWVMPNAQCFIHASERETSLQSMIEQNQARRYYVTLTGGRQGRLVLYETILNSMRIIRTGVNWIRQRSSELRT